MVEDCHIDLSIVTETTIMTQTIQYSTVIAMCGAVL